jgi:DNA-binding transcriptional LysR family regulator
MARPDLNLLVALDVLLEEGSVATAARRLRLSPSAMSRTLARLREATGDPLLVRAGRGLVPTPRAAELSGRVGRVVEDAEAVLRPAQELDLSRLDRTFTIRTREGFVETFGVALLDGVARQAPRVRLRFVQKLDKGTGPLREAAVDLETGVVGQLTGPEVRAQALFRDRFIAVVRDGHPLSKGRVTPVRFASSRHVAVSRREAAGGPVDARLEELGLVRDIAVIVTSFSTALALARSSDLVATVPERHTAALRTGMRAIPLPFPTPPIAISLLWHPRFEADPAHRWLRGLVREVVARVDSK